MRLGGRTPWKEPLSEPYEVVAVRGNKLTLKKPTGELVADCHIENCVKIPDRSTDYERSRHLLDLPLGDRLSIGEAMENPVDPAVLRDGKLERS